MDINFNDGIICEYILKKFAQISLPQINLEYNYDNEIIILKKFAQKVKSKNFAQKVKSEIT